MDEQVDGKMLVGTYVCTEQPGEFRWQPGSLTQVSYSFDKSIGISLFLPCHGVMIIMMCRLFPMDSGLSLRMLIKRLLMFNASYCLC